MMEILEELKEKMKEQKEKARQKRDKKIKEFMREHLEIWEYRAKSEDFLNYKDILRFK